MIVVLHDNTALVAEESLLTRAASDAEEICA